jgi:hypothetical protein
MLTAGNPAPELFIFLIGLWFIGQRQPESIVLDFD